MQECYDFLSCSLDYAWNVITRRGEYAVGGRLSTTTRDYCKNSRLSVQLLISSFQLPCSRHIVSWLFLCPSTNPIWQTVVRSQNINKKNLKVDIHTTTQERYVEHNKAQSRFCLPLSLSPLFPWLYISSSFTFVCTLFPFLWQQLSVGKLF